MENLTTEWTYSDDGYIGDRFCRQNFESFRFVTSDRPNSDFSFQWFGHWNVFWLPVENFTINEFYDSIGNSDSGSPILKILIKFLKTIEILHFFSVKIVKKSPLIRKLALYPYLEGESTLSIRIWRLKSHLGPV